MNELSGVKRNIVNPQDMDEAIKEKFKSLNLSDKVETWVMTVARNAVVQEDGFFIQIGFGDITKWKRVTGLDGPVPPWARKALMSGQKLDVFVGGASFSSMLQDMEHAIAYLKSLLIANPNANLQVIPYDKAVKEGDQLSKKKVREGRSSEQLETVLDVGSGFKWVSLLSSEALPRESNLMGHCVGNPIFADNYGVPLDNGDILIWSLRDSGNKPHCTIQILKASKYCAQIKGKRNAGLVPRYIMHLVKLLNSQQFKNTVTDMSEYDMQINCISRTSNEYVTWHNPPDNIQSRFEYGIERVPSGIAVTEDFATYFPFPIPKNISCSAFALPKFICKAGKHDIKSPQIFLKLGTIQGDLGLATDTLSMWNSEIENTGSVDIHAGSVDLTDIQTGKGTVKSAVLGYSKIRLGAGKILGETAGGNRLLQLEKMELDLIIQAGIPIRMDMNSCSGILRVYADQIEAYKTIVAGNDIEVVARS